MSRLLVAGGQSQLLGGRATGNGLLTALVAYWAFDDAAGANDALDKHTNGLTLTQLDSPGSAAGKVYAGARTFDGTGDYFKRADETLVRTGVVDWTISLWMYPTASTPYRGVVGKHTGATTGEYIAYLNTDRKMYFYLRMTDNSTSPEVSTAALTLNEWAMITIWHDSAAKHLYIQKNADAPATDVYTGTPATYAIDFNVGSFNNGTAKFAGRIGPVAFWKSAAGGGGVLSAAKIAALYNAGAGLTYAAFTA